MEGRAEVFHCPFGEPGEALCLPARLEKMEQNKDGTKLRMGVVGTIAYDGGEVLVMNVLRGRYLVWSAVVSIFVSFKLRRRAFEFCIKFIHRSSKVI